MTEFESFLLHYAVPFTFLFVILLTMVVAKSNQKHKGSVGKILRMVQKILGQQNEVNRTTAELHKLAGQRLNRIEKMLDIKD